MKRDLVEFWAWRIGIAVFAFGLMVFIMVDSVKDGDARRCAEAQQGIESFERCEAHAECTPSREDMSVLIDSEKSVVRNCKVDEDE